MQVHYNRATQNSRCYLDLMYEHNELKLTADKQRDNLQRGLISINSDCKKKKLGETVYSVRWLELQRKNQDMMLVNPSTSAQRRSRRNEATSKKPCGGVVLINENLKFYAGFRRNRKVMSHAK